MVEVVEGQRTFTLEECHRMGEAGVFAPDERVELIRGIIRKMSPKGRRHVQAVTMLNSLLTPALKGRATVQVQAPLPLRRVVSEPEPEPVPPRRVSPTKGNSCRQELPAPPAQPRPAVVEPLAPARYKVQFTASVSLRDKLERLRSLTGDDLADAVEAAVTEKLERLEARKFGTTKSPRKTLGETDTRPTSRRVPAAVRRFVSGRDGKRCTFVADNGKRCDERRGLELHHHDSYGRGGITIGADLLEVPRSQRLPGGEGVREGEDGTLPPLGGSGARDATAVRSSGVQLLPAGVEARPRR